MFLNERGKIMYSASSKAKLQAVATAAAALLIVAAPPVALAAVQRHLALPALRPRRAGSSSALISIGNLNST
jgi:hypothetical protein